jgi:hypothetical protein
LSLLSGEIFIVKWPGRALHGLQAIYKKIVKYRPEEFRVAHYLRNIFVFDNTYFYFLFSRLCLDNSQRVLDDLAGVERPQVCFGRPRVI